MVSVGQGCYIGQETLSKLTNLDAVKQQLWGLELSTPANVGNEISGRLPFVYNDRIRHCSEKEYDLKVSNAHLLSVSVCFYLQMAHQRLGS